MTFLSPDRLWLLVAVSAQQQVVCACGANGARDVTALPCGRLRVPRPQLAAPGLHLAPPTGLGIDEREHADRRQLELARVDHLDRKDLVASAEAAQRPLPARLGEEVGDDDG